MMKKKAICLLMSAMLVATVLGGCGDKDADSRAEEAMSNLGSAVEAGDEDAAMEALEELGSISEEEEAAESSEGEEAYPVDPRWADVKPTESAIQYNDIFIKTGMTVGEVLDEVDNSESFLDYGGFFNPDQEIRISQGRNNVYTIEIYPSLNFVCDSDVIITLSLPKQLPGVEGDAYIARDLPVIGVEMNSGASIYSRGREVEGFRMCLLGTSEEIMGMTSADVENLQNTLFSGMNVELNTSRTEYEGIKYLCYLYKIPIDVSWNGYSMEEDYILYDIYVDAEEDRVITWGTRMSQTDHYVDWTKD